MFKKKKGQAALEFLMTYGWAILVVLIIIGVIAAFVLRNPQQFLPTGCRLTGGLQCVSAKLSEATGSGHGFQIAVRNAQGNPVAITAIELDEPPTGGTTGAIDTACNTAVGTGDLAFNFTQRRGADTEIITSLQPGDTALVSHSTCAATNNAPVGTRVNGQLMITYQDLVTGFEHTATGTVTVDVEP